MKLFDRDAERATLRKAAKMAGSGQGRVAAVLGDAGIGKTSLIRELLANLEDGMRVLSGTCDDLGIAEPLSVLRDLAREAGFRLPGNLGDAGERLAIFSDALKAFAEHRSGTVLFVEDVHWADEATVDFLRFFARRISGHRILLVVTSRTDEVVGRTNLRRIIGEVPPDNLDRIELGPLSKGTVDRLSAEAGCNAAEVYEATAGNAFYVTELLRTGGNAPSLTLQDAVLARRDRLSPAGREALDAAAVFPRAASVMLLSELTGHDATPGIDDCVDHGLLESDGQTVAFRHALARQAVLSELRPHIRRSLNAELLLILEAQGVSPGYMLHHAREAGNTEQVRRLAPRAAREASELGARREAAAFFGIALEAEGPGASADLLEEVAHAHYMVGLFPEAVGFQKRAQVIHAQSLDPLREGDGARRLSRYLWGQSKTSEAFAEAERAAQILANRRGPELALALSSVAQLRMPAYDYDRVEDLAESAIALAREFDRPDIESHALNNLAMARTYSDPGLARAGMQDSLEIAQRIGHDDHVIRAYTNFTYLELLVRNYKAAREQAVRGIAFAEEQELDAYYNYLIGTLACVELNSGHHDRAFELASPHFVSADFVSTDLYRFSGAVALFCLATRKGEVPDANAVAVLDQFRNPDAELQRIAPYAEALAERAWITGSGIEDALGMLRLSVEKSPISEAVQSVHVWLHRLDASAHTPNMDRFNDFHRLELEGRPEEAAAALEPLGARYEQALALAQGGTDAKIRAIAILEEIGASASAARVQSMLPPDARPPQRKGPRASTRENAAGLTKRQMDVLRELDNGLSNAEIAEKLFVSPKTVDHHVSAILGKLDAQNRSEAAAIARRTGLI